MRGVQGRLLCFCAYAARPWLPLFPRRRFILFFVTMKRQIMVGPPLHAGPSSSCWRCIAAAPCAGPATLSLENAALLACAQLPTSSPLAPLPAAHDQVPVCALLLWKEGALVHRVLPASHARSGSARPSALVYACSCTHTGQLLLALLRPWVLQAVTNIKQPHDAPLAVLQPAELWKERQGAS